MNSANKPVAQDDKIKKSLSASIHEGALNSASATIFSTFIVPLALALKASNLQIGFLSTAQELAATAGQIPGAKMTAYFDLDYDSPYMLFVRENRGKYFGKRNVIVGASGVITTLVAGFIVGAFGFAVIFSIGLVLTIFSLPIFMRMYEPVSPKVFHYKHDFAFNPKDWIKSVQINARLAIFTLYSTVFNFAVQMAAPFYTVYMLKDLAIGYELFSVMIIAGAATRLISFKYWGYLTDKYGSRKILLVTGVFACFTPFGWMLSSAAWQIFLVKIFDGFIFAGMDQVVFNYLLDATPANKRPQHVANYNFFAGLGIVFGAVTGGLIAESMQNSTFLIFTGLQIVFFSSFIICIGASLLLSRVKEIDIKQTDIMPLRYVFWQTLAVEPASGLKNVVNFTFRSTFDREAEYVKAIRKRQEQQARENRKNQIIEGTQGKE